MKTTELNERIDKLERELVKEKEDYQTLKSSLHQLRVDIHKLACVVNKMIYIEAPI